MAATYAISSVRTFKDSGQEFRGNLVIGASGTYTTGGDAMSFKHVKVKTKSKPTFGMGVASNGATAFYDVANNKITLWDGTTQFASGGSLTGVTLDMSFWFPKA